MTKIKQLPKQWGRKKYLQILKKPPDEEEFEDKIIEDIIKKQPCEHKKNEAPYVPPIVKDVIKIEDEIKTEINDFSKAASEFNKVDAAATRQKKVDIYKKLFDDVEDIPDRRQEIDDIVKTEDIFIDDHLFNDTDTKDICNLVDQIKSETDVNNILFEHEPIDTTPDISPSPEPLLDFSDILLKNNKGKNKTAKKIRQK